jgi:hypothetical protein
LHFPLSSWPAVGPTHHSKEWVLRPLSPGGGEDKMTTGVKLTAPSSAEVKKSTPPPTSSWSNP